MRGRGLKPLCPPVKLFYADVAPHAGAWIETAVSLLAGVAMASPPMRGRGLKLQWLRALLMQPCVAPHAGAWIETSKFQEMELIQKWSPPMRGRGLKLPMIS